MRGAVKRVVYRAIGDCDKEVCRCGELTNTTS